MREDETVINKEKTIEFVAFELLLHIIVRIRSHPRPAEDECYLYDLFATF